MCLLQASYILPLCWAMKLVFIRKVLMETMYPQAPWSPLSRKGYNIWSWKLIWMMWALLFSSLSLWSLSTFFRFSSVESILITMVVLILAQSFWLVETNIESTTQGNCAVWVAYVFKLTAGMISRRCRVMPVSSNYLSWMRSLAGWNRCWWWLLASATSRSFD